MRSPPDACPPSADPAGAGPGAGARTGQKETTRRRQVMSKTVMSKTGTGNFFEDFRIGQVIRHATPRTITAGDVALYNGLFGPRFAVQSSDVFARGVACLITWPMRKSSKKLPVPV